MSELMGRESTAEPGRRGGVAQLIADSGRRARSSAGRASEHAEQSADRERRAELEPRIEVLPAPAVQSDLSPFAAFAPANQHRASYPVEVGFGQPKRFADPQASASA